MGKAVRVQPEPNGGGGGGAKAPKGRRLSQFDKLLASSVAAGKSIEAQIYGAEEDEELGDVSPAAARRAYATGHIDDGLKRIRTELKEREGLVLVFKASAYDFQGQPPHAEHSGPLTLGDRVFGELEEESALYPSSDTPKSGGGGTPKAGPATPKTATANRRASNAAFTPATPKNAPSTPKAGANIVPVERIVLDPALDEWLLAEDWLDEDGIVQLRLTRAIGETAGHDAIKVVPVRLRPLELAYAGCKVGTRLKVFEPMGRDDVAPVTRLGTVTGLQADGHYTMAVDNGGDTKVTKVGVAGRTRIHSNQVDPRPDYTALAKAFHGYQKGLRLLVLNATGTLVDADVVEWTGRETGSNNYRLQLVGDAVEMALNEYNHCEQLFDHAMAYEEARYRFEKKLEDENTIEDAITGKLLDLRTALVKVGAKTGSTAIENEIDITDPDNFYWKQTKDLHLHDRVMYRGRVGFIKAVRPEGSTAPYNIKFDDEEAKREKDIPNTSSAGAQQGGGGGGGGRIPKNRGFQKKRSEITGYIKADEIMRAFPISGVPNPTFERIEDVEGLVEMLLKPSPNRRQGEHQAQPVLIMAGPGTGKTLSLEKLHFSLATEMRRGLGTDTGYAGVRLVPLLIRVQELAKMLRRTGRDEIKSADYITEYIKMKAGQGFWNEEECHLLTQALQMNGLILLLDGVDEAAGLSDAIERWVIEDLVPSGVRLVVTSRPEGVKAKNYTRDFVIMSLKPLRDDQATEAIRKQLKGNEFFEMLDLFSKVRKGHDDIYNDNFDAIVRGDLESINSFDVGVKTNPDLRHKHFNGDRFIAPADGANVESKYLRRLDEAITPPLLQALDSAIEFLIIEQRKSDKPNATPTEAAVNKEVDEVVKKYERHDPKLRQPEYYRVVERLGGLMARLMARTYPEQFSSGQTPTERTWEEIKASTDEMYVSCEGAFELSKRVILTLLDTYAPSFLEEDLHVAPLKDPVRTYDKAAEDYKEQFKDNVLPQACVMDILRCKALCSDSTELLSLFETLQKLGGHHPSDESVGPVTVKGGVVVDGVKYDNLDVVVEVLEFKNKFIPAKMPASHLRNALCKLRLSWKSGSLKRSTFMEFQVTHKMIYEHDERLIPMDPPSSTSPSTSSPGRNSPTAGATLASAPAPVPTAVEPQYTNSHGLYEYFRNQIKHNYGDIMNKKMGFLVSGRMKHFDAICRVPIQLSMLILLLDDMQNDIPTSIYSLYAMAMDLVVRRHTTDLKAAHGTPTSTAPAAAADGATKKAQEPAEEAAAAEEVEAVPWWRKDKAPKKAPAKAIAAAPAVVEKVKAPSTPQEVATRMLRRIATANMSNLDAQGHMYVRRIFNAKDVEDLLKDAPAEERQFFAECQNNLVSAESKSGGIPLVLTLAEATGVEPAEYQFRHISFQEALFVQTLLEDERTPVFPFETDATELLEILNVPAYENTWRIGGVKLGRKLLGAREGRGVADLSLTHSGLTQVGWKALRLLVGVAIEEDVPGVPRKRPTYMSAASAAGMASGQYELTAEEKEVLDVQSLVTTLKFHHDVALNVADVVSCARNVETLLLSECNKVEGSLSSISGAMHSLRTLDLNLCRKVIGDLDALSGAVELERLDLSQLGSVEGNISSLAKLTRLTHLNLSDMVHIEGDLSVFGQLVGLEECQLDKAYNLTGSIGAFASCPNLRVLSLVSCSSIDGDIGLLSSCQQLTNLELENTKVRGTMDVFRNLLELKHLNLRGVKIKGDIANLSGCVELHTAIMNTVDSALVGNVVDAFKGHTKLRKLDLKTCFRLQGSAADLEKHKTEVGSHDDGHRSKWAALMHSGMPALSKMHQHDP